MRINIDENQKLGKIKDMNATGQAPMGGGIGYGAYGSFRLLSDGPVITVDYIGCHYTVQKDGVSRAVKF